MKIYSLLAAFLLVFASFGTAGAAPWQIDYSKSKIEFTATYSGSDIKGSFEKFTADVDFNPNDLGNSSVRVEIPTASIQTNYAERDQALVTAPWFDTTKFPVAVFISKSFKNTGDKKYRVDGVLTIKGVEKPFGFDFEFVNWQESPGGAKAVMKSDFVLSRGDFKIGEGEWAGDAVVANKVVVQLTVAAQSVSKNN